MEKNIAWTSVQRVSILLSSKCEVNEPTYFRYHANPILVPSTPTLAHAPPTHQAHRATTHTYALFHVFDSRATHARTLLPAALASVPFGFVLVRVRVQNQLSTPTSTQVACDCFLSCMYKWKTIFLRHSAVAVEKKNTSAPYFF